MALNAEQEAVISQMFEAYISEYHQDDMVKLLAASSDDSHRPVVINAMTLFEANMEIGDYFNAYPSDVLTIFDKVLHKTAMELSGNASVKRLDGLRPRQPQMNHTLHARITGLPVCPELTRDTIPRSRDVGHFLSVTGTVIRTSVAKVLEYGRDYMCTKCRHVFVLRADFEQFYAFVPPAACPNPDGCNSCKFSCLSGGSEPTACRDYQEIKIQEQVQRLSVGSIPRSMVVVLEDDLVDSCKSGDDVTVYGVMCQRWKPFYEGARCDVELVLKANNVEVNNQQGAASLLIEDVQKEFKEFWESHKCDPIAGRNQILLSLCPQVFGMYVIKLAVAMVLAGGVQRIDSSGTKTRGECHLLLVGDPGTGKSQFLKYAAKMMPRSVLTAGIGSTSAGLTVAAVKDGGDWHLEAGALVLSDGGLCCIDEFNSIKEHDRISIHEAMEQQSISVAKAGMVCKLNTRTTILAATNPKSQYDPKESLSVNIALASPLLSRFDLVLVLLDNRNTDWDRIISSFILEDRGLPSECSALWPMEKMKAYFCVIKRLQPQVSVEANSILSRYYQLQRQSEGRNAARTTIRMLESLSRLAEAHARLMYRETVTIEDAVMAVSVMECSMQGGGLLGSVNAVLTSFPDDPGQQYQTQCQVLLGGLKLPVLLQKEMDRLARLGSSTVEASSSEQPTDGHHPHPGETDSITAMQSDVPETSMSGAEPESGLDWFYSITPSRTSNEISSAVFTSTQLDANQKTDPGVTTKASSPVNYHLNSKRDLTVTVTAEEGGMIGEKHPDAQENLRGPDRQHAEPPGSAIQLRRKLQQSDKAEIGLGESEVAVKNASQAVTVSDATSNTGVDHRIQSKPRFHTATKTMSARLPDTIAASDENIPFKFSDFVFKPKKMTPVVGGVNSGARSPECNLDSRNGPNVQHKVGSNDEAKGALPRNDGRKNKTREKHPSFKGGSVKKQVSCVSNKTTLSFPPEELEKDKPPRAQTGGTISQRPDMGSQDGLRSKESLTPLRATSSPAKSTVTPSTLAKLSRFSFSGTTEPRPTLPADLEKNHQLEKSPREKECVELSRTASDRTTEERPKRMKRMREVKAASSSPNASQNPPPLEHGPAACASIKLTEPTPSGTHVVKMGQGRATVFHNSVKMKKKCLESGTPASAPCGSKAVFVKTSLFGSGDLNDDILDTDWDKEVAKKAKVRYSR
ncbi:DNA helicase MCM9 isoform X2 [Hippocampus comes]|nr:PREDICTED: DNA helicase MCM9 isoform X2 [Hippocampus comes]XP_019751761.1 PREDICTED: DNA helicase MCM9 isoform X2 [Hippocampus comes]